MNYRTVLAIALLSSAFASQAASLCGEKEADIQREIGYAEKHHNQNRIDGLNKALKELRANCSDSGPARRTSKESHQTKRRGRRTESGPSGSAPERQRGKNHQAGKKVI